MRRHCLQVDPASGAVVGWVRLGGLRDRALGAAAEDARAAGEGQRPQREQPEVLNGIAWDEQERRLFVTGKPSGRAGARVGLLGRRQPRTASGRGKQGGATGSRGTHRVLRCQRSPPGFQLLPSAPRVPRCHRQALAAHLPSGAGGGAGGRGGRCAGGSTARVHTLGNAESLLLMQLCAFGTGTAPCKQVCKQVEYQGVQAAAACASRRRSGVTLLRPCQQPCWAWQAAAAKSACGFSTSKTQSRLCREQAW